MYNIIIRIEYIVWSVTRRYLYVYMRLRKIAVRIVFKYVQGVTKKKKRNETDFCVAVYVHYIRI